MSDEEVQKVRERFNGPRRIGVYDLNMLKPENLDLFGKTLCDNTAEVFYAAGAIDQFFWLFLQRDPRTEEVGSFVYTVSIRRDKGGALDEPHKDTLAGLVQLTATMGKAVAVVLVSETWNVRAHGEEEQKRVQAHFKQHGSYENYPGRRECLYVQIEHARGFYAYTAEINESADPLTGKSMRKLDTWEKAPMPKSRMGRFVRFLEPVN